MTTDELNQKIDDVGRDMDSHVSEIGSKWDEHEDRLNNLKQNLGDQIRVLDSRVDALNNYVEEQTKKLDQLTDLAAVTTSNVENITGVIHAMSTPVSCEFGDTESGSDLDKAVRSDD